MGDLVRVFRSPDAPTQQLLLGLATAGAFGADG